MEPDRWHRVNVIVEQALERAPLRPVVRLLALAASALLGTACVDSAPPLVLRGELDTPPALVERMEALNVPGLSVAVLDEGQISPPRCSRPA